MILPARLRVPLRAVVGLEASAAESILRKMGFQYWHLGDSAVRAAMVRLWEAEWEDLQTRWQRDQCYGKQLSDAGWAVFPTHMREALAVRDDDWLLEKMSPLEYWQSKSPRRTKTGITMVNYNKQDALERLCVGEFNIAFIHGLAQVLLERGETSALYIAPIRPTSHAGNAPRGRGMPSLSARCSPAIESDTIRHPATRPLSPFLPDPTAITVFGR